MCRDRTVGNSKPKLDSRVSHGRADAASPAASDDVISHVPRRSTVIGRRRDAAGTAETIATSREACGARWLDSAVVADQRLQSIALY